MWQATHPDFASTLHSATCWVAWHERHVASYFAGLVSGLVGGSWQAVQLRFPGVLV